MCEWLKKIFLRPEEETVEEKEIKILQEQLSNEKELNNNLKKQIEEVSQFGSGDINLIYIRLNGKNQTIMIDENENLSESFIVKEFISGDNHSKIILHEKIVFILQLLRDYYNRPIIITSGYRTKNYNDSLRGSSKNSKHLEGKAVDFLVKNINPKDVQDFIRKNWQLLGIYGLESSADNHVHIDIRESDRLIEF
ncbi:MAG: D-Ala-D-Ala carboxypeptidase family metallohydrolase [Bacilli bacterium]